jgi:hypothetical protein
MTTNDSFEATYTRYDFAPLVRIGVAIAAMVTGSRLAKGSDKSDQLGKGAVGSAA